jgi:hypothetical protein
VRARHLLTLALVAVVSLTGCDALDAALGDTDGGPPPPDLREALHAVCGEDAEIVEEDPAPEDGYDERRGEGRTELLQCEKPTDFGGSEYVYGARYTQDPTPDVEDSHAGYQDADGSTVSWGLVESEEDGEPLWTVVYAARLGKSGLRPLEDLGFELHDGEDG